MEPANHALKSLKLRAKINLSSLRVMCCGLNIQEADARNLISNTTELGGGIWWEVLRSWGLHCHKWLRPTITALEAASSIHCSLLPSLCPSAMEWGSKNALTRCWLLDLGLPGHQNCRPIHFVHYKLATLWHSAITVQNRVGLKNLIKAICNSPNIWKMVNSHCQLDCFGRCLGDWRSTSLGVSVSVFLERTG